MESTAMAPESTAMTPTSLTAFDVFYVLIRLAIVAVNVFGNTLILLAMSYSKIFSRVTRHLIGHLAAADLLFGLAFSVHAVLVLSDAMTYQACLGVTLALVTSGACSSYGICLVCLDNYIAIHHIFTSSPTKRMSLAAARIWIVSGWALMFLCSLVYVLTLPEFVPSETCDIGGPQFSRVYLIFLWVVYCVILVSMLAIMVATVLKIHQATKTLYQAQDNAMKLLKQRSMKRKVHVARVFGIISLGCLVSWGPLIVALIVFTLCPGCGVTEDTLKLLSAFTPINACVNALIYAIKDDNFKTVVRKTLRCQRNQIHSMQSNT